MLGVRDLLFLNEGDGTFREVGAEAGLEVVKFAHGLGVVLTDVDLDDDLDIYLANDTEPDRLYKNVAWPGGAKADPAGLGFRFEEVAAQAGVADPGAGMGVASGDYDGDARPDLFVTNLREQGHGVFRTRGRRASATVLHRRAARPSGSTCSRDRAGASRGPTSISTRTSTSSTANGHVPLTDLTEDAQVPQVFENGTAQGDVALFTDASKSTGIADVGKLNARGSAVADYDSDGDLDVAIAVVGGPLLLLENQGEGGRWLEVELTALRARHARDRDAARRPEARARGAGGLQLRLVGGPAPALRPRDGGTRGLGRGPLARRLRDAARRRRSEPAPPPGAARA